MRWGGGRGRPAPSPSSKYDETCDVNVIIIEITSYVCLKPTKRLTSEWCSYWRRDPGSLVSLSGLEQITANVVGAGALCIMDLILYGLSYN